MKRRDFLKTVVAGTLGATIGSPRHGKTAEANVKAPSQKSGRKYYTIDAFSHFSTMGIIEKLESLSGQSPNPFRPIFQNNPALIDPSARIQAMDRIGADVQILIPLPYLESSPAVYTSGPNGKALEAARFINDTLYNIVKKYPTRFRGVALLPSFNVNDMLSELNRTVNQLGFVGGYFVTSPLSKAPDHPDYLSLYEKACQYDVPLWIHPGHGAIPPDYAGETASMYMNWMTIGWPMDTSVAMNRIVFSGVFAAYPNLKVIIHHRGGLIPFWFNRIIGIVAQQPQQITKAPPPYLPHFQKFYIDTACSGFEPDQMRMSYNFFPPDHTLFGTDAPLDMHGGSLMYQGARESLENIGLTEKSLEMVYSGNAKKIIRGL